MKSLTEILLENAGLRIAARDTRNNQLKIGSAGQIHSDLVDLDKEGEYDRHEMGFVDPSGTFMNRKDAFKYSLKHHSVLDKKEFSTNKKWNKSVPSDRALQSHDLRGWHEK